MYDIELPEHIAKKRILVVDDQGSLRAVFKTFLNDAGFHNVHCTIDGAAGIKFLTQKACDLIICDWAMPKLTGLEVLKVIRAEEATKDMPFMMVTSTSEMAKVKLAVELGVSDYLIKPFKPGQLCLKTLLLLDGSNYQAAKLPAHYLEKESTDFPSS